MALFATASSGVAIVPGPSPASVATSAFPPPMPSGSSHSSAITSAAFPMGQPATMGYPVHEARLVTPRPEQFPDEVVGAVPSRTAIVVSSMSANESVTHSGTLPCLLQGPRGVDGRAVGQVGEADETWAVWGVMYTTRLHPRGSEYALSRSLDGVDTCIAVCFQGVRE